MAIENEPAPTDDVSVFAISAFDITVRTMTVWLRRLLEFLVVVGITLGLVQIVGYVTFWIAYGSLNVNAPTANGEGFSIIIGIISNILSGSTITYLVPILFSIVALIISPIVTGAGIKLAFDDYGNPGNGSVGESFGTGIERSVKLIAINLVVGLIVGAFFAPIVIVMLLMMGVLMGSTDPYVIINELTKLTGPFLASMIIAVFGIYIWIRFMPAMAVGTVEDLGVIDSVKRAYKLTSGNFWHVLGSMILIGLAVAIIQAVISLMLVGFTDLVTAAVISDLISVIILSPINIVFQAVLYKDLYARSVATQETYW